MLEEVMRNELRSLKIRRENIMFVLSENWRQGGRSAATLLKQTAVLVKNA